MGLTHELKTVLNVKKKSDSGVYVRSFESEITFIRIGDYDWREIDSQSWLERPGMYVL